MQDLKNYLTFAQVAVLLPNRPSSVSVWRWATKGLKAPDGSRIKLKFIRMGGTMLTTLEWIDEFAEANTLAHEPHSERIGYSIMPQRQAEQFCMKGSSK